LAGKKLRRADPRVGGRQISVDRQSALALRYALGGAAFAASRNAERFAAAAAYNFTAPPPNSKTSASLPAPSNRPNAGASMIHNPKLGAPQ
jgi:hypothetical protein